MACSAPSSCLRNSLLLTVLLAASCGPDHAAFDETPIRALLEAQVHAWNDGDIAGYMQGYWQDDSTVFVSGGSVFFGYDSLEARYRRSYPDRAAMGRLTFEELVVSPLGTDAALARGIWRIQRASDAPWGRFTLVLRRTSASWEIVYDHTSSAD